MNIVVNNSGSFLIPESLEDEAKKIIKERRIDEEKQRRKLIKAAAKRKELKAEAEKSRKARINWRARRVTILVDPPDSNKTNLSISADTSVCIPVNPKRIPSILKKKIKKNQEKVKIKILMMMKKIQILKIWTVYHNINNYFLLRKIFIINSTKFANICKNIFF